MIFSPIIGLLFFISFASGCQEFPLGLDRILEQDALLAAIISPSSCTHSPLLTKNSQHLFLNELASPSTLSQAMLLVKKVIVDLRYTCQLKHVPHSKADYDCVSKQ